MHINALFIGYSLFIMHIYLFNIAYIFPRKDIIFHYFFTSSLQE